MSFIKEVHTKLILNINDLAYRVEAVLSKYMDLYEDGYYLFNQTSPSLRKDEPYFVIEKFINNHPVFKQIKDINEINGTVFNKDGMEVFYLPKGLSVQTVLRDTPHGPYKGMELIKDYAYLVVFNLVLWGNFPKLTLRDLVHRVLDSNDSNTNSYSQLFRSINEHDLEQLVDELRSLLIDVETEVKAFMNRDYMHMYDIERKHCLLYVTKLQDYRIYEYERLKNDLINEQ